VTGPAAKLNDLLAGRLRDFAQRHRRVLIAVALGASFALTCPLLPHDYQAACRALASICTGGYP
jgi:hypothetical protein